MPCVSTKHQHKVNITSQASKATMRELLQDEIDKCRQLVDKLEGSTKTWSTTVGSLMMIDIESAEKALREKDDSAMFRTLRSLRIHNNPNY